MFEIATFRVFPSGKAFNTSRMFRLGPMRWRGDRSNAYFRAHLHAAQYAAEHRSVAYVTRDDRSDEQRMGFGPDALFMPTTALFKIVQMGIGSYFDYNLVAWLPLPTESANESQSVGRRASAGIIQ